jgi:hypothetical protein
MRGQRVYAHPSSTLAGKWMSKFGKWMSKFGKWMSKFGKWMSKFGEWMLDLCSCPTTASLLGSTSRRSRWTNSARTSGTCGRCEEWCVQ